MLDVPIDKSSSHSINDTVLCMTNHSNWDYARRNLLPGRAMLLVSEEKMQWVIDHDREAQQIAHRGGLWMKDMVFYPDAEKDDQAI
jgi:hypothetical protein